MELEFIRQLNMKSEEDTRRFGLELAENAVPGEIIALIGDLGTGKTALTRYIAEGLGIKERVNSPTFTIVKEYHSGRLPLYHFDVYRVHDSEELFEIGFEDYLHRGGVGLIEWANLLEEGLLPENTMTIKMEYGEGETERILTIE